MLCLCVISFGCDVNLILSWVTFHFKFCLQHLAKRRLQYAMPRVPLEQLKKQQQNGDIPENNAEEPTPKATSMLTVLRRKIAQAMQRNQHVDGMSHRLIEDDAESVGQDETQTGDSSFAAAGLFDDEKADHATGPRVDVREQQTIETTLALAKVPLTITNEEMEVLKNAEIRLQKANRGRKLRVVVLESDSENDNGVEEYVNNHENVDIFERDRDQDGEFVVKADIHQAESMDEEEHIGDNTVWADDGGGAANLGGARPKTILNKKTNLDRQHKKHTKIHQGRKQEKGDETQWGMDESSESDGDWYSDLGDTPLLRR